jgi:hypothetical protein
MTNDDEGVNAYPLLALILLGSVKPRIKDLLSCRDRTCLRTENSQVGAKQAKIASQCSMLPQEPGGSENGKPGATDKVLRIPSDNGVDVIVFSLTEKHGIAECHLLGDIGCHFRDESAPPSFAIVGPQPVNIYDKNGVDGAKAEEPGRQFIGRKSKRRSATNL